MPVIQNSSRAAEGLGRAANDYQGKEVLTDTTRVQPRSSLGERGEETPKRLYAEGGAQLPRAVAWESTTKSNGQSPNNGAPGRGMSAQDWAISAKANAEHPILVTALEGLAMRQI